MADTPWGFVDPQDQQDELALSRKKALAQALIAQSQETQPMRTAGKYVVPFSWGQGLQQLGNAYFGGKMAREADKEQGALTSRQDARRQAMVDQLLPADATPQQRMAARLDPSRASEMALKPPPEQPSSVREYQFARTNGFTGSYQDWMKSQRPQSASSAPVTLATIQDPKDPNKTIVVDGRSGRVIGPGPKLTQTGAADQKLALAYPQAKMRTAAVTQNLDRLSGAMDELDKMPGLSHITGTVAGRTPNLTNDATNAQAQLDSITSQIFVSALQAMRESSKTGGAVGNVSDREGDKLERTIAALGQAQSTEMFRKHLQDAKNQLRLSKELIQGAFDEQYGGVQEQTAPAAGGDGISPEAAAVLKKHGITR